MSKIVVTVKSVNGPARFISHVRRVTGMGVGDIRTRLDGRTPLIEWTLFMNDYDEVAQRLRDLMTVEERDEGALRFFELMPDERFSDCPPDRREISVDVLQNIYLLLNAPIRLTVGCHRLKLDIGGVLLSLEPGCVRSATFQDYFKKQVVIAWLNRVFIVQPVPSPMSRVPDALRSSHLKAACCCRQAS